tara:strand:- start:314 stop:1147 length:834 start_codon:yes stop_codon:yes gene_type:complete
MILWLASYPKSGNTLLRSILATYFFSEDGIFNFNHLYKIGQFPSLIHFENLGIDTTDSEQIYSNIIKAQEIINSSSKQLKFFKTHSALAKINNNNFTDLKNTLGAIYVIRDPRNVVTSFAHHYQIDSDEATKCLLNEKFWNYKNEKVPKTFLSSWKQNYNSWKQLNDKTLFIKYEDLIKNKKTVLIRVFKFFESLGAKLELDMVKLNKVIKSTEFEKMKDMETKETFRESIADKETGKKIPFFNLGPKNDWKKILSDENREKIEKAFKEEMLELGYL